MINLPNPSLNSLFKEDYTDISWWNRPILGKQSFLEFILSKLNKPILPDHVIALHRAQMMDLRIFAKTAVAVDNDQFFNREFLLYLKIKSAFDNGIDDYQGLSNSLELFQVAIEAKNSYITLDQTELRYRSSKQQELYDFAQARLTNGETNTEFRLQIQEKLIELLPQIKTAEGRNALKSYVQELAHLAEHELGLKLLSLFKAYHLADYSILRIISDLVMELQGQDVTDLKKLVTLVTRQYEVFEKLGKIIGVPEKQNTPSTYAKMIQYMVLGYKHKASYIKFQELINILRLWEKSYQAIQKLHQEYPDKDFKRNKEFSEPIPGLEIYQKYQKLIDKQGVGNGV